MAAAAPREPVTQLIDLLSTSTDIAPDRVWALYVEAMQDRPQELADGSIRVPRMLQAGEHRQVLQALVPYTEAYAAYLYDRGRIRALREAAQSVPLHTEIALDLSTPQELAPRSPPVPLSAGEAKTYLSRARTLLGNMRAASADSVCTADYNEALAVLAPGGYFGEMQALWSDMTSTRDTHPETAPNRETYHHMMEGLFRQAARQAQDLQAAHGHALLPTEYGRRRSEATAAPGDAAKSVQGAAQVLARSATMLIQDMHERAIRPSVLTLDLAARVLRMTGQLPALLALLRTGFGVDVANPDADRGEALPPCAPTTHTLNTALMALGEYATVSDMVAAYETMTEPLSRAESSTLPSTEESRCVQPNAKTFATLLKHACTVPETLFLAAALVPERRSLLSRFASSDAIGFATQSERQEEIKRRERGAYFAVARYFFDECMQRYAAQVAALCTQLKVDAPALAYDGAQASGAVRRAYRDWRAQGAQTSGRLAVPDARVSLADGAPVFVPPSVGLSLQQIYPLVALASRRRSLPLLGWIRAKLDHCVLLKEIEANAVEAVADAGAWPELHASLEAHLARVRRELDGLHWIRFERLPARHAAVMKQLRERKARRAENHTAKELQKKRVRRKRDAPPEPVLAVA